MHIYLLTQYLFCTFSSFFTPQKSIWIQRLHHSHDSPNNAKPKFPGFFEVFPELDIIKWPQWIKKNGKIIKCEKDEDCMFPQACCHHPIVPGDKFCCSGGYKQRNLQFAFLPIPIPSEMKKI